MAFGRTTWLPIAVLALSAGWVGPGTAQEPSRYATPPKMVVDILDAKPLPQAIVSPSRLQLALVERRSMPTIADSIDVT